MPVSVVDASAIAAVVFGEAAGASVHKRLRGHQLIAPKLFEYELTNVCLRKCREKPEFRDDFVLGLRNGLQSPVELLQVNHESVFRLAEMHHLSGYDASYLWLSMTTSTALVTLDHKLKQVARRLGVA